VTVQGKASGAVAFQSTGLRLIIVVDIFRGLVPRGTDKKVFDLRRSIFQMLQVWRRELTHAYGCRGPGR